MAQGSAYKLVYLSKSTYTALSPKDSGSLYFCKDTKEIYKGSDLFTEPVRFVNSFSISTPAQGVIYINESTGEGRVYNGSAWKNVILPTTTVVDVTSTDNELPTAAAVYNAISSALSSGIATDGNAIKGFKYTNNTLYFYNITNSERETKEKNNQTVTPVGSVNFPEEKFLDLAKTTLVSSFTYSASTYPNSSNPNLDGKVVLVLALTTDGGTTYSFIDMAKLVDSFTGKTASEVKKGITIKVNNDNTIEGEAVLYAPTSEESDNLIKIKNGSLYVPKPEYENKMDKITGATTGNLVAFDSNGNASDSGSSISSLETTMDNKIESALKWEELD